MTLRDKKLAESEDFTTVAMPFALYCAFSDCNTTIHKGSPAKRFDPTTYVHVICPSSGMKNFAIHKYGDAS